MQITFIASVFTGFYKNLWEVIREFSFIISIKKQVYHLLSEEFHLFLFFDEEALNRSGFFIAIKKDSRNPGNLLCILLCYYVIAPSDTRR